MKYLNNLQTGELIRINKISDNGIFYSIFENKVLADSNQFSISKRIDNNLNGITIYESNKTFGEIKEDAALIDIALTETEFTINEDEKNWCIPIGSDGTETLVRLTIPNAAYDNALRDKNKDGSGEEPMGQYYPLWQVISFGTATIDSKYSNISYNAIVLYLLKLLPEHKAVIDMYESDGVVIENKI